MEQHSINPAQSPCWHLSWAAPSLQPNPHTQFCFQLLTHRSTHTHTHTRIINTRTRGLSFLTLLVRQADATQHSTGKNSEIKEMPTCNFRLSVRREWPFASMWIPVQPWNLNPEKPAVGFFPNLFWGASGLFQAAQWRTLLPYPIQLESLLSTVWRWSTLDLVTTGTPFLKWDVLSLQEQILLYRSILAAQKNLAHSDFRHSPFLAGKVLWSFHPKYVNWELGPLFLWGQG